MNNIKQITVEDFSNLSFNNEPYIHHGEQCGCYSCLSTFDGTEVTEWADTGTTAVCPHCGVDSVLPGIVDPELLKAGLERWFCKVYGEQTEEG